MIAGESFGIKYSSNTAYTQINFPNLPDEAVIYKIQIFIPNIPNIVKTTEMMHMISDFFGCPEDSMTAPYRIDDFLGKQEIRSNILLYALISILIQANLQLIFIHLIHKRKKEQESFILAGCSALRFRLIVLGEVLLFLVAGTAVGWLSFNGMLLGYIKKIIEDFPILYESVLFKYGCLCYIGAALAFSVLNVIFNVKSKEKSTVMRRMEGGD